MSDLVRPAYRCPWCFSLGDDDPSPAWRIERVGDAVVSWACDAHLGMECADLQRLGFPAPTVLHVLAAGTPARVGTRRLPDCEEAP